MPLTIAAPPALAAPLRARRPACRRAVPVAKSPRRESPVGAKEHEVVGEEVVADRRAVAAR
eukprot:11196121-Lingulodinium_polyedra.AAC.1